MSTCDATRNIRVGSRRNARNERPTKTVTTSQRRKFWLSESRSTSTLGGVGLWGCGQAQLVQAPCAATRRVVQQAQQIHSTILPLEAWHIRFTLFHIYSMIYNHDCMFP